MAKQKFHDEAKYAPRRAHLMEGGVRMGSWSVQCSIDGDVQSWKGLDHWEVLNNPVRTHQHLQHHHPHHLLLTHVTLLKLRMKMEIQMT